MSAPASINAAVETVDGHELRIGPDAFATRRYRLPIGQRNLYVLSRNGGPQQVFVTGREMHDPDGWLGEIGGRAVWEFRAYGQETVVSDGQDVRSLYGLEAAYTPYSLDSQLIFIARMAGKYLVVYDGGSIGPLFDRIMIQYCCDPFGYSARGSGGRYTFWGWREQQLYLVVIQGS
jgi:hypothetical protein